MSNRQLTVRGLIIGALGSIVLTMSSMFIALKLSSVPWPIDVYKRQLFMCATAYLKFPLQ